MSAKNNVSRRNFLQAGSTAGAIAFSAPMVVTQGVWGANDTVNLGVIGPGRRAGGLMNDFRRVKGTQFVAVSDVNKPRMDKVVGDKGWKKYQDFRNLLDDKDVDAVIVATPDHWHALNSIYACMAGKDVYVEKPMTLTIAEGRAMVKAARKYNAIVQCGSQQRSSRECRVGCELVRNGRVGKIKEIYAANYHSPWEQLFPEHPVPDGLDWDMWLGMNEPRGYHHDLYIPRAKPGWISILPYSGGEVTGWGAHGFDIIQWGMGADESGPVEVWAEGNPRDLNRVVHMRYANGAVIKTNDQGPPGGGKFIGEKGSIIVDRGRYVVEPEDLEPPSKTMKSISK